ncbi:MAG: SAM-dependent methyltransferase [Thermoguttaceae bacterium]
MNSTTTPLPFLLATCPVGVEHAVKSELAATVPDSRFAYSRPGLLTFKLPGAEWFDPKRVAKLAATSVWPQTLSVSLGNVNVLENNVVQAAHDVWQQTSSLLFLRQRNVDAVHVWPRGAVPYTDTKTRDRHAPRDENISTIRREIVAAAPTPLAKQDNDLTNGDVVLDVVVESAEKWFVGCHVVADAWHTRFAGGIPPIPIFPDAVSRARYKFEEGLQWSRLPVVKKSVCLDLGAAPGGASQALLARGAYVIGVDPGEIAPEVLNNPRFVHIRRRTNYVRHRDVRDAQWIVADMNVAPSYTMSVLGDIVTRPELTIHGLLFTLKLFHWKQVNEIAPVIANLKNWGYNHIAVRHLAFNRQEVMVAATRQETKR